MRRKRDMGDIVEGYFNDPDYECFVNEHGGITINYKPRSSTGSAKNGND